MVKVVIVEDEPSAMRYLKAIIELRCNGFEIIGTAENGIDGLEKIRSLKPDVVITDIKMAGMDGIELVARVREEFPFIYSVIVSGYQDFEYAKGAIKSGVVDYLLKPVNPKQLKSLLDTIKERIEKERYERCVLLLKQILNGKAVESWQAERYLPYKYYSAAILRQNGLPSRFASKHAAGYNIDDGIGILSNVTRFKNTWILPGRDERELIFFHAPESHAQQNRFKEMVGQIGPKLSDGYYTIAFTSKLFELSDCKKTIANLYRTLDNNIVIGLSQVIFDSPQTRCNLEIHPVLDGVLVNKIGFLVTNRMYDELKQEFIKLFNTWEREKRTQLWVESNLRQILYHIKKYSTTFSEDQNCDIEFMLDEALYYSTTFGELMANIWEIVKKIVQHDEKRHYKVDTLAFFRSIEEYLEQNISEQLSLQSVCSVFGISQTYLSRLFRKYENMSFNEYLTMRRIDKAKRLIEENPNMPLKDVASIVGYSDQFYFSRVFRSITGMPPSEYAAKIATG
ncbi:response regulator transcription factor [Caldanaerobius polysaccharolyticus]|uniref:response regulator transcription factor n=1 Tax=Caldanaerobius polysaccharolyticus TaxID=44256 RepID=UPI00047EF76D|nr:response regulator [Caldanaerobius polysaccharolyticus]